MPIDPVKIPQNVYIEDRIVGPLTLRQIITMAIGGGISYSIYASLAKAYGHVDIVTTVIVWMPALIAAAFAIIKVNDLTLSRIVLLIVERMLKAPVRTWTPREGMSINIKVMAQQAGEKNKADVEQKATNEAHRKIEEISSVLDTAFDDKQEHDVVIPAQAATPTKAEVKEVTEETSAATVPVNPAKIRADKVVPVQSGPAVFHDIIPHSA